MWTDPGGPRLTNATELWETCAQSIREQVSDGVWNSTFKEARPHAVGEHELVLTVPSQWVKERIEARYFQMVVQALDEIADRPVQMIIEVDTDAHLDADLHAHLAVTGTDPVDIDLTLSPVDPGNGISPAGNHAPWALETDPMPATNGWNDHPGLSVGGSVNDRYTFDSFVTGTSNRFAHAAALSVAERPSRSYNPLFIYGDAGLGKTHLLQAIGSYVNDNYAGSRTLYVSTETFLSEFIEAIRANTRAEFKRRYREIDVLLVDDIQFMAGKEGMQEEFFHTFNTLYQANKQIVLSSDRPPDAIATLEDRLRSRFKMGLITDIQPPDLETRIAILRKKAEAGPMAVPDDVMEFIASNVTDNIRELEGALTRVSAFANLYEKPLTVELATDVLHDLVAVRQPRPITPDLIMDTTSEMFGFTREEIIGQRRHRPLVTARQIAMYVFRDLTDLSYPAIAREFGGRDHTTVIHAVDKIGSLMADRRQIYEQVTELIQRIKAG
ncbi:MAG: chromosomal replication initiator protein DnaA [Acidimicrobiales bacterium]